MKKQYLAAIFAVGTLTLGGCTVSKVTQGNYATQAQLSQVHKGMSRSKVEEILGSPSFTHPSNKNIVYYYGAEVDNKMVIGQQVQADRTVEITYNALNNVKSVRATSSEYGPLNLERSKEINVKK